MSILHSIYFVLALGLFLLILKKFASSCSNLVDSRRQETLLQSKNVVTMVLIGAFLSAVTQSSSIVVIMVIGLVEGRVISSRNGLAAVLGTEVGTTVTGQLLSLPSGIIYYILPFFFLISFIIPKLKPARKVIIWFAFLIGSLYLMGIPIRALTESSGTLIRGVLLTSNESVTTAITIGLGFTALIQSSSALTALAINLGRAGVLQITGALGLVIGANLGTCVTGFIASFAFSKETKVIVIGQILFNLLGVVFVYMIFDQFINIVIRVTSSGLIERQIANGQTLFNIFSLLAILPFFSLYYKTVKGFCKKLL